MRSFRRRLRPRAADPQDRSLPDPAAVRAAAAQHRLRARRAARGPRHRTAADRRRSCSAALPAPVRFALLPCAVAWALTGLRVDGRPAHVAAVAIAQVRRRRRAGPPAGRAAATGTVSASPIWRSSPTSALRRYRRRDRARPGARAPARRVHGAPARRPHDRRARRRRSPRQRTPPRAQARPAAGDPMRSPLTFAWRNVVFGRDARRRVGAVPAGDLRLRRAAGQSRRARCSARSPASPTASRRTSSCCASSGRGRPRTTGERRKHSRPAPRHDAALRQRISTSTSLHCSDRHVSRPEVYVAIRLGRAATRSRPTGRAAARDLARAARRARRSRSAGSTRCSRPRSDSWRGILDFLDAERATTAELQWLVRRCFAAALGEPGSTSSGDRRRSCSTRRRGRRPPLRPARGRRPAAVRRADHAAPAASLRIETETGDSHQAFLVARRAARGRRRSPAARPSCCSRRSRPCRSRSTPCFSARWIAERPRARAGPPQARRRRPRLHRGAPRRPRPDDAGAERPARGARARGVPHRGRAPAAAARADRALRGGARPGGARAPRRARCAASTRRSGCTARSARSSISSSSHLPAQRQRRARYDDVLLLRAVRRRWSRPRRTRSARRPAPTSATRCRARAQPVLFDVTEGSRTSRPPAVLCAGTLGSGKTLTAQLLAYQAFLAARASSTSTRRATTGSTTLIGAEHVEAIELRPGDDGPRRCSIRCASRRRTPAPTSRTRSSSSCCRRRSRRPGRPRSAPRSTRASPPARRAAATSSRACESGDEDAREAARAIAVHADVGAAAARLRRRRRPPPAGRRRAGDVPAHRQPHAAAARHPARGAHSPRSGPAARCCACSRPTRCT